MALKKLNAYNIDVFKLSNARHEHEFQINDAFFEDFEDSEVTKGQAEVKVDLNKSETMITASIKIKGHVELACDRSLEPYHHTLDTSDNIIFKYGDDWEELSDEIITVPRDVQRINLAQYIYEFIGLAIPMKRLHPKFEQDELDDDDENIELIYTSLDDSEADDSSEEDIDPRWNKLKGIKK